MKDLKTSALEILEDIGQEDERAGIQATKFFMDQWDKKQWEENQFQQESLKKTARFTKQKYFQKIAAMLYEEMKDLEIPSGYLWEVKISGQGVSVHVKDRKGKRWARGFTPCGTPKYDHAALTQLVVDADTTVQNLENEILFNLKSMGMVLK